VSGGRIRSIKPELLEDEDACALPDAAWRIWISCWCLADDHGNLRAGLRYLAATIYQDTTRTAEVLAALKILSRPKRQGAAPFLALYVARGEVYAHLSNWEVHQRIVNPSKPRVPTPAEGEDVTFSRAYAQFLGTSTKPSETLEENSPHARALEGRGLGSGPGEGDGPGGGMGGSSPDQSRVEIPKTDPPKAEAPNGSSAQGAHTTQKDPEDPAGSQKPRQDRSRKKAPAAPPSPLELASLDPRERAAHDAIARDPSLSVICSNLPQLAQDLSRQAPLVDLPVEIAGLGAWLRANPSRAKKDGDAFLVRNIGRKQRELSEAGVRPPSQPASPATSPQAGPPRPPPAAPPPRPEIAAKLREGGPAEGRSLGSIVAGVGRRLPPAEGEA
jgi:hypothetical protein